MEQRLLILITGIFAVSLLDAAGAIISRKFNFNYGRLSFLSFLIYAGIGYCGMLIIDRLTGVALTALVGLYDAIVGWKIALALKADFSKHGELLKKEIANKELGVEMVIFLTVFGGLVGWVGTLFG